MRKGVSEKTIANLFPNYFTLSKRIYTKQLLHINKNDVYLIENQKQTEKKSEVIKTYIQFTRPNIVKTGSEQMQQMYFLFLFIRHSICEKKVFFRLLDNPVIECRVR